MTNYIPGQVAGFVVGMAVVIGIVYFNIHPEKYDKIESTIKKYMWWKK